MKIDTRRIRHLGSDLVFLTGRCGVEEMDARSFATACFARVESEATFEAHVLTVILFSRLDGDAAEFRELCLDYRGQAVPHMHFAQAPCEMEGRLVFLIGLVSDRHAACTSRTYHEAIGRSVQAGAVTWVSVSSEAAMDSGDPAPAFAICFDHADKALRLCASTFADIARTWTSYGGSGRPAENALLDEFQSFNRAREAFYAASHREMALAEMPYCANTGLRDWSSSARLVGIGARAAPHVHRLDIANPRQSAPSTYSKALSAAAPLFARGYAVGDVDSTVVWVSGVVSVVGGERVGATVEAQTRTVVANLEALLAPDNLQAHGIGRDTLGTLRIPYVFVALSDRNQADFVRDLLRDWLPPDAMLFLVEASAFALPNLLVEVDCIAHFSRQA